jgi:hypothetical protein
MELCPNCKNEVKPVRIFSKSTESGFYAAGMRFCDQCCFIVGSDETLQEEVEVRVEGEIVIKFVTHRGLSRKPNVSVFELAVDDLDSYDAPNLLIELFDTADVDKLFGRTGMTIVVKSAEEVFGNEVWDD